MCFFSTIWYWISFFIPICLGYYIFGTLWYSSLNSFFYSFIYKLANWLRTTCTILTRIIYMLLVKQLNLYLNVLTQSTSFFINSLLVNVLHRTNFIEKYYIRSEYIWQDGFLFDFLQKKTADLWVRQFVIYTGFIFSERFMFENVVRLYLDYLIWPGHNLSLFETNNVSDMLNVIIYTYASLFLLFVSMYIVLYV